MHLMTFLNQSQFGRHQFCSFCWNMALVSKPDSFEWLRSCASGSPPWRLPGWKYNTRMEFPVREVTGDPDPALWHTRARDHDLLKFPASLTGRIYKIQILCFEALPLQCRNPPPAAAPATAPAVHPKVPKPFWLPYHHSNLSLVCHAVTCHLISKPALKAFLGMTCVRRRSQYQGVRQRLPDCTWNPSTP